MTNQHPIMPPDELVQQWRNSKILLKDALMVAAQWGADQELEACSRWIEDQLCMPPDARADVITKLNDTRRPKPPSLKKQALNGLEKVESFTLGQLSGVSVFDEYKTHIDNIRRALEALPE
jgi:hypothetical protein